MRIVNETDDEFLKVRPAKAHLDPRVRWFLKEHEVALARVEDEAPRVVVDLREDSLHVVLHKVGIAAHPDEVHSPGPGQVENRRDGRRDADATRDGDEMVVARGG